MHYCSATVASVVIAVSCLAIEIHQIKQSIALQSEMMQSINGNLSFAASQGTIRSINSLNDSISEIHKLFSIQKNETDTIRDSLEGQIYSFPAASCAPPHSLATTGSLPRMAQLCMCTVT